MPSDLYSQRRNLFFVSGVGPCQACQEYIVGSSASRLRRMFSSPSTPCSSKSASRIFSLSSSASSLSPSASNSDACLATRNFLVSSWTISLACLPLSWLERTSRCWEDTVASCRDSFLSAVSASRVRSSLDCCRVERESLTRERADLSGAMLKLETVARTSCYRVSTEVDGKRNNSPPLVARREALCKVDHECNGSGASSSVEARVVPERLGVNRCCGEQP